LEAAHRAGLTDIEIVARAPIESYDTDTALRFPRQAQFHPLKYLAGLAHAIKRDGGRIYTQTHASKIEGGDTALIETSHACVVTVDSVVVATNIPVNDLFAIHTKQSVYLTYVIGARVPSGSAARALFWDTPLPYHYIRVESADGYDVLISGGEDHKSGQKDDANVRFAALERWTRTRFPMMTEIEFRWSGEVMEPIDGLAFIGRNLMDHDNVSLLLAIRGMA
jgi:glycine/D-amino acid oxidase-like deaminating enzyme